MTILLNQAVLLGMCTIYLHKSPYFYSLQSMLTNIAFEVINNFLVKGIHGQGRIHTNLLLIILSKPYTINLLMLKSTLKYAWDWRSWSGKWKFFQMGNYIPSTDVEFINILHFPSKISWINNTNFIYVQYTRWFINNIYKILY